MIISLISSNAINLFAELSIFTLGLGEKTELFFTIGEDTFFFALDGFK